MHNPPVYLPKHSFLHPPSHKQNGIYRGSEPILEQIRKDPEKKTRILTYLLFADML